ncbi:MAG: hypothetical protein HND57_09975 [Planctomycetes bacterium]|nr:hypothetical protein [Planctomycetota bacterium]
MREQTDSSQLAARVQQIEEQLGPGTGVYWFGYRDPTLLYYLGQPVETIEGMSALLEVQQQDSGDPVLVLADRRLWDKAVARFPELPEMYRVVDTVRFWPTRQIMLMVPVGE